MTDAELARLKRIVRTTPDSLRFVALGEALRGRGELDEALRVLSRGLRHHPNLHSAQSALARVHAERGEPHRALALVSRLMERDPTDYSLRVLQVELLCALNRRREAAAALSLVPKTDPRHARLAERLKRPGDPFATRELAERLERAGRLERASSVWQTIARQEQDEEAAQRAERLAARTADAGELEVVALRDERSAPSRPGRSRPGHLRRLLALFRSAEQERAETEL